MAAFCTGETRRGEESPGSMEARCRLTAGGGDPRESATESKPPVTASAPPARVKGCGKSAPRPRRRGRHGKPHREQDRIGTALAGFRAAVRVGRARRPATDVPDEWPSIAFGRGQNPAYRPSGAKLPLTTRRRPAGWRWDRGLRIFDAQSRGAGRPPANHRPMASQ